MKPSVSLIIVQKEEKRQSAGESEEPGPGKKMAWLALPSEALPLCEVLEL